MDDNLNKQKLLDPESAGSNPGSRPTARRQTEQKRGSSRQPKKDKVNPKQTLKKLKVGPSNTDNLESDDSDQDDVEVYRVNANGPAFTD